LRHKLSTFVMIACLLFPVLTTIAMISYPGGTRQDPHTVGYRFFENFFSELGLTQSHAGGPQTASFILFTIALSLAGAALIIYYLLAPSLFHQNTAQRITSWTGSFFGLVSGASFVGVAFTLADVYLAPHALFVQLAFIAFFIAVTFYAAAIFLHPEFPDRYAWVNLSFGLLLGVYIWLLFNGPAADTIYGLVIQVTGQKLIAYAAVACMFVIAYGTRHVLDHTKGTAHTRIIPGEQPSSG